MDKMHTKKIKLNKEMHEHNNAEMEQTHQQYMENLPLLIVGGRG